MPGVIRKAMSSAFLICPCLCKEVSPAGSTRAPSISPATRSCSTEETIPLSRCSICPRPLPPGNGDIGDEEGGGDGGGNGGNEDNNGESDNNGGSDNIGGNGETPETPIQEKPSYLWIIAVSAAAVAAGAGTTVFFIVRKRRSGKNDR